MTDKPTPKPEAAVKKTGPTTDEKLAAVIEVLRANGMTIPKHLD